MGSSNGSASNLTNAYWDTTLSGMATRDASSNYTPTGKSDSTYFYSQSNAPLTSWDFSTIWQANSTFYPTLK